MILIITCYTSFEMRSSLILISCSFVLLWTELSSSVNWSVDENTVPESLPQLMRNGYYTNEDIQKAVFWTYKIQNDVISEHNGHVFDAESPLGYINDHLILPETCRVSLIDSDVVFENNTISGLANFKNNKVIIKWSQDRVSTEVAWKYLKIKGKYKYLDGWRYSNGDYQIVVEDVLYQADTPLSRNAESYPLSVPNAAINYTNFTTIFTGDHSVPNEILATQYFLEEVAFRHIADHATEAARKNVTSAIRAAVRPYVLYKNRSDPHFPGTTGRLDDGREFVVSGPFADGLDNAVQKVKTVWLEPYSGDTMIVSAENTLHNLSGTFDLRVTGPTGSPDQLRTTVDFAVDRVGLSIEYDALKPNCYCSTAVQVHGTTARAKNGVRGDDGLYQQVVAAFVHAVNDHLSVGTCAAIVQMNRYGHNPYCSPPMS